MIGPMTLSTRSPDTSEDDPADHSAWAPLRQPLFARIWIASLVSNFGGMIQAVGAAWLMTSLSRSADTVALVQAAQSLPMLAFALVFGAVADIYDRRLVMLSAQTLMLVFSVALAAMTYMGLTTPFWLLAFTFLIGCGTALHTPAWQASVSEQVQRHDLPRAIALNGLGFNLARSLGPAAGGLVVAMAGAPAAFLVNAATYLGLIVVLAAWRRPKTPRTLPAERLAPAVLAGLQYARLSPTLSTVLIRAFLFAGAGSAIWALTPLVARQVLQGGPAVYGLLLGGLGAGAVGAALGSNWLRQRFSTETIVRGAGAAFAVAMVVVAVSPWLPVTLAALVVGGMGWMLSMSSFNVTVQTFSPGWVVGRSVSLFQTAMAGGLAIGSWGWGLAAQGTSVQAAIGLSAAAAAATTLLGLRWAVPVLDHPDFAPARAPGPLPIALEPTRGGVAVIVEYRVAEADAAAFVAAMVEKRRIRRRDGARRWTLLQDLGDPEVWVERFQSPSWVEHLRHRHRTTVADLHIEERVRAFHRGETPPLIRRFIERLPGAGPDLEHPVQTTLP